MINSMFHFQSAFIFTTVRTLNRKIQDALGITPGEFRVMNEAE